MNSVNMTIKKRNAGRTISVSFDADKFERVAANFGFFNPDFLRSLQVAERDIKLGRVKEICSLKDLRK